MKYYVIVIMTYSDKDTTKSVYEFDSSNAAVSRFHQALNSAYNTSNCLTCVAVIIDEYSNLVRSERYAVETT